MVAKKRPSRRKPAAELTDEEALRRLFPKEVRDEAKHEAKSTPSGSRTRVSKPHKGNG